MPKIYKSEALAAVHEMMEGLHDAGSIDKRTMREFDEACLAQRAEDVAVQFGEYERDAAFLELAGDGAQRIEPRSVDAHELAQVEHDHVGPVFGVEELVELVNGAEEERAGDAPHAELRSQVAERDQGSSGLDGPAAGHGHPGLAAGEHRGSGEEAGTGILIDMGRWLAPMRWPAA